MLEYQLSGKHLIPLLSRIRKQCCDMGEITPTPLAPTATAVYLAHIRYPPDPEQFRHVPSYAPSLQPHSFAICFELYQHSESYQHSERSYSLRIRFLFGHDKPGTEPPESSKEKTLVTMVEETQQAPRDFALRNGYTPYLKLVADGLVDEWKKSLQENTPSPA